MVNRVQDHTVPRGALPPWFRQTLPDVQHIKDMQRSFRTHDIATVCESARCPNMGECWKRGVATFMILGDTCTRACRFCAVKTGLPSLVNPAEPDHVADMAVRLGLRYVVVTSVTRDDLEDEGAGQFVRTVCALRERRADVNVELLIPDFSGKKDLILQVACSGADVLGHNIEMVSRIFPKVRPEADYNRSLQVLRDLRAADPKIFVKSGLMVGLGETDQEVEDVMKDLREAGCDLLTIGQYLAPSDGKRHVPVERFVDPGTFDAYRRSGMAMGFRHVFSAPLVRSSYIAETGYQACCHNSGGGTECVNG